MAGGAATKDTGQKNSDVKNGDKNTAGGAATEDDEQKNSDVKNGDKNTAGGAATKDDKQKNSDAKDKNTAGGEETKDEKHKNSDAKNGDKNAAGGGETKDEKHKNSDVQNGDKPRSDPAAGSAAVPVPDLDPGYGSNYLIVRPEKGGFGDLFRYGVLGEEASKERFLYRPEHGKPAAGGEADDHRLVIVMSILVRKIIGLLRTPMEYIGFVVDFFLNLLSENGGVFGLLLRLIHAKVAVPKRGSETFISTIGHIDGRIDLYKGQTFVDNLQNPAASGSTVDRIVKFESGNRGLLDLCMMASKLAYENAKVVENVVRLHWKMNFLKFLDCWNDYQKEMSTQVFILTDKPKDANLIVVSFRGTEPFDADDWCTDFDYSWFEIPKLGKIHMGFLEALGLGNRDNVQTFERNVIHSTSTEKAPAVPLEMVEKSAYYALRQTLKRLLVEHGNAKFVVTGHSLGGALAILFPTVLVLHQETEIMKRLLGVYTFGQPRIADRQIGKFMETHLNYPVQKYFRVVYCNDLVPRLPYDDQTFLYKHFGVCLYYDSFYKEEKMEDEPNPNSFGLSYIILAHINAVWELIRGMTMGYTHGPDYKEGWFATLIRFVGLALPGLSAHAPTDYVNSVRLGPDTVLQMSPL